MVEEKVVHTPDHVEYIALNKVLLVAQSDSGYVLELACTQVNREY